MARNGIGGPEIVALITARGGSKRLPRKNILPLAGRPMVSYSIEAARHCRFVSRCIVTTDNSEIRAIALADDAEVIDRPAQLASDEASSADVILHALKWLETRNELPRHFVLLQPTSPLRNQFHLHDCLAAYLASDCACAISVCDAEHHPFKTLTITGGHLKPLFGAQLLGATRQSLPQAYRPNGAIYVMRTDAFRSSGVLFAEPALPFIMNREDSLDVDTLYDFEIAQRILEARKNDGSVAAAS